MNSRILEFIVRFIFFEAMYLLGYFLGYRQGRDDGRKGHKLRERNAPDEEMESDTEGDGGNG